MSARIFFLTLLTLVAFASNSILCRLALADRAFDAATFTAIRLACGALLLAAVNVALQREKAAGSGGNWLSGALLFSYAAGFSFAYLQLSAGTGGLILFGTVQLTMIGWGIWKGERPSLIEWIGLILAQVGLVILVAPGLHAPSPIGASLMAVAGISWGIYSLRGRHASDPGHATKVNFVWSVPFALMLLLCSGVAGFHTSLKGILLAVVSGAVTSAPAYMLWYLILPKLTASRAAISQLAVPAIVAIAGVLFLNESISFRILAASALM
ncbi:MAG TPA: DMT family transporter, partial [Fimbriimonadaceae bacterium]|nr:DMT family transporter [Fimbriimonadaceae bacterium]